MKLIVDMFYGVGMNRGPKVLHIASVGQQSEEFAKRWATLCKSGKIKELMYPTDEQLVELPVCTLCEEALSSLERPERDS